MLNENYTAKLLDLEDVIITNVEKTSNQLHIFIELPRREHICPVCGSKTNTIHDYRTQIVKDIPLGKDTFLHLRKRRYRCCCGKRFFENNTFLPRYHRATSRMISKIIQAFRNAFSAKSIGSQYNVSGATAMRYFNCFNSSPKTLPRVVSIDEFKGNAGGQKYNCIFVDPENKKVLDILPDRYENHLIQYFSQFPSKKQVEYFICDMNPHFKRVAQKCFPNATIVADKYHVVRQVYWAMERVRKNEQKKLSDQFRKYFKHSRFLLSKPIEKLDEDDMKRLALMFEIAPALADAYRIKNDFLRVIHSKNSSVGAEQLKDWLWSVELMDIPEFNDCVKAYRNWYHEILNSMDVPWTNGFIEGCNNKTKVLKRVCYGMPNFSNFRKRILFCHT